MLRCSDRSYVCPMCVAWRMTTANDNDEKEDGDDECDDVSDKETGWDDQREGREIDRKGDRELRPEKQRERER